MSARAASWALWALVLLYAGGVAYVAWRDLTARYSVVGLHRNFDSPYPVDDGVVVDPRPTTMAEEMRRRYGRVASVVRFDQVGPGDGAAPRLLKVGDTVWLAVGRYGRKPVVFVPRVGVVLLDEGRLADAPAATLEGYREAPW